MYLAQRIVQGRRCFFIRRSQLQGNVYVASELMDLGTDPGAFIVYPGGRSFYIHEQVEDCLSKQNVPMDYDRLEDLFWPFVHPDIKRSMGCFRSRNTGSPAQGRLTDEEEDFISNHLHPVDRRRYNYLRTGEIDQATQGNIPLKFYRPLAFKSRDELEHKFMDMEVSLEAHEFSVYVYSFLHLRRFFSEIIAGKMPQGLDSKKLDRLFMDELCDLNRDDLFWKGAEKPDGLHACLVRYAIMFFDYPLGSESFMQDHLRDFFARNRQRFGRIKLKKADVSPGEASRIMGVPGKILYAMSKRELTKVYRSLAMKMHPDKGGDHEAFIRLTEVYRMLLAKKD